MENKKNQAILSVLGVFALVIVTVGASYAFFSYSRTGTTTSSITSGDVSFSYRDVKDVTIKNAFPVADVVGLNDTENVYEFSVTGNITSSDYEFAYDVTLLSDNNKTVKANATDEELAAGDVVKGYFINDAIKVNLVKNDTDYLFGTQNTGVKLSTVTGFTTGTTSGVGKIVNGEKLASGQTDNFKLRMWIAEDVDYSNTVDGQDEQTSVGKYSGFTYTLKVKVDSEAVRKTS